MVKLFRRQKRFVEINLAPKKKWEFIIFLSNIYPKLKSKNFLMLSLSTVSFISIFLEDFIAQKIFNEEIRNIHKLQKELAFQNIKIRKLRRQLKLAEQKFKNFYIPYLKEKIFYIWYYSYGHKKIWKVVNEFYSIVKGHTTFLGFRVFPSPYGKILENVIFKKENSHEIIYKPLKGNPFVANKNINNSFIIYVNPFELDKNFAENLNKIKDKTIKANLLLEYGLLTRKIKPQYIKVPIVLEFPINLFFEKNGNIKQIITKLVNFCNIVQIDSAFSEKKISWNGKWINSIINGICIKYTY